MKDKYKDVNVTHATGIEEELGSLNVCKYDDTNLIALSELAYSPIYIVIE